MHELKEEGTHHKLEEIYAKIVDEYFPNLEQVINIKTGPKSGISIALYNAAFGIIVALPSLVFYRHFRSTVDSLMVQIELQAVKLVEMTHGKRTD